MLLFLIKSTESNYYNIVKGGKKKCLLISYKTRVPANRRVSVTHKHRRRLSKRWRLIFTWITIRRHHRCHNRVNSSVFVNIHIVTICFKHGCVVVFVDNIYIHRNRRRQHWFPRVLGLDGHDVMLYLNTNK